MDQFPKWADRAVALAEQPVTHGLNLALKLKSPDQLPWMIWDVTAARPIVEQALEDLSFLHYARFVPSWDGTALMVITEFDGPLEPYVMDFVIAIGEVFDVLLRYVEDPPPLPVRRHPAEFLDFVKRWNRVPFIRTPWLDRPSALFPEFDYPLHSAYPELSVVDIAGPRTGPRLPPPSLDRPAAQIDLADVQGNILRGYRAKAATHLFLQVRDPEKARRWIAGELLETNQPWLGIRNAEDWGDDPPALMTNVAFTFEHGLKRLLPNLSGALTTFPEAFREGALERATLNGDKGPHAPSSWLFGQSNQEIGVVLSIYTRTEEGTDRTPYDQGVTALRNAAAANGLIVVVDHKAEVPPNGLDHFGYRDGITQPRISGQCPVGGDDFQPASSPGEFLLGSQYADIYGGPSIGAMPVQLATNGCFAAMRLLEQDLAKFREFLNQYTSLKRDEDALKARLMGRWPDGTPMSLDVKPSPAHSLRNDFDFAPSWEHPDVRSDHDGRLCPVGSHIRRTNPRNARVAGMRHTRRLIRRGMPSRWGNPQHGWQYGLLGLFFCGSLERQFEFIQREWIQGGGASSGKHRNRQDPIAGLREGHTDFELHPGHAIQVPQLVKTRGSLYLFYPGMRALREGFRAPVEAPAASAIETVVSAVTSVLPDFRLGPAGQIVSAVSQHARSAWEQAQAAVGPLLDTLPTSTEQLTDILSDRDKRLAMLEAITLGSDRWFRYAASTVDLPADVSAKLADLVVKGIDTPIFEELLFAFGLILPEGVPEVSAKLPILEKTTHSRFVMNPCSEYAKLRQTDRNVVWVPEHKAVWVLDRPGVERVLDRPYEEREDKRPPKFVQLPSTVRFRGIITADQPDHTRIRDAVEVAMRFATRQYVETLVSEEATAALHAIGGLHHFDFVTAYGNRVPRQVFWRFYGVMDEDLRLELDTLARTVMRHFGQPERPGSGDRLALGNAAFRLTRRIASLLLVAMLDNTANIGGGSPTFLREIAGRTVGAGEVGANQLSFFEALLTLVQFVLAGSLSIQFLTGTAALNLLRPDPRSPADPDLPWKKLADMRDEEQISSLRLALEEVRRFDPPVTIVQRYVGPSSVEFGGITIQPDCAVFAVVASANRAGSPDMEAFHWNRPAPAGGAPAHLSLGHGIHACVGRLLQDWIVPATLLPMLKAMPDLKLCYPTATPAWLDNIYFRSLNSLPVVNCPPNR